MLVRHSHIDTFLQAAQVYLEKDEALNNLMLGIALRIQRDPNFYQRVEMFTLNEGADQILAALVTVPEKLIIYSTKGITAAAVEQLVLELLEQEINVPGVIGPKKLAEQFAAVWSAHTGCSVQLAMHMGVYELRQVNEEVIGEGSLRPVKRGDLDLLTRWIAGFHTDTGLINIDMELCRALAKRRIAESSAFFWEHQGTPVSIAAQSRPTLNGITINMVYTPREYRGRGYATSCVASLSQQLLHSGYKFCALFTDLANPTPNKIYRDIGYRYIGDFGDYRFS